MLLRLILYLLLMMASFALPQTTIQRSTEILRRTSALVVDVYNSSEDNKAIIVQRVVEFVERGEEFKRLYDIFYEKFEWVREDPWKEGDAPFVKVKPLHKISEGRK